MKSLFLLFTTLFFTLQLNSQSCPTTADYVNPSTFSSSLVLNDGDTLLLTSSYTTTWTSITVRSGGRIIVCDSSIFRVNGSLSVNLGGLIVFLGCDSKLEVFGTYDGGYNTCELEVWCNSCTSSPLTLLWGVKIWDEYCCVSGVLPVELASFSGVYTSDSHIISWSTLSEVNNDYFDLQFSTDGIDWINVAQASGNNGNSHSFYSHTIMDPIAGYYRLKQVDYDGNFTYSNIIYLATENMKRKEIRRTDILGREVGPGYKGIVVIYYSNGTNKKAANLPLKY